MIPGEPYIIKCPKCRWPKSLSTCVSMNTIGGKQWSDAYWRATMAPIQYPIQKCGHCGHYFLLSRAKRPWFYSEKKLEYPTTGRLCYEEVKEALEFLLTLKLTPKEQLTVRSAFIHSYNDAFRNFGDGITEERSIDDRELHRKNLLSTIPLLDRGKINDTYLIAEFFREAGEFNSCIKTLEGFSTIKPYLKEIADIVLQKALCHDDMVFELPKMGLFAVNV